MAIFEKREHLDELTPYMDEFTKLMIKLVGDLNFKTCINSLNIIGFIIKLSSEDWLAPHLGTIVTALMERLGDSKIAIR